MSDFDYMKAAQQRARDAEQQILKTHHDELLLLVKAYWLFNPHITYYELITTVTSKFDAYSAAYHAFPFDELPRPEEEWYSDMRLLMIRFRAGTTCVVLTTAQLRQLIQTRDSSYTNRLLETDGLYFP